MVGPLAENGEDVPLEIRFYPNPAKNELTIEMVAGEDFQGELYLFDMNGRVVQQEQVRAGVNRVSLDLFSGIYIACIRSKTGIIYRNKVVILR